MRETRRDGRRPPREVPWTTTPCGRTCAAGHRLPRRARPVDDGPAGVPPRPVRRRAGLGPLPARASAASACRGRCRPASTARSPRPARPTTTRARNGIGLGMAAPTILAYGTDEQKQRFLRPLWTGEEIWCQLFSEPGAGSDLAAARAPARSATATSGSSTGRRCGRRARTSPTAAILLARTDPDVPKHRGITYFIVDMHRPGVDVRPLRQITGEARVQRGVPHRRAHPRRQPARRRGRRLEGRHHHADATSGSRSAAAVPRESGMVGVVAADLARAPRAPDAGAARPAAAAVGRGRGGPPHRRRGCGRSWRPASPAPRARR